jgi:dolichyl-diphosphooligosaccharide--protein glycosyltransferase
VEGAAAVKAESTGWRWECFAWLVTLAGLVVRLWPARAILGPGGPYLPGTDPHYHLWRAERLAEAFPALPSFDPWLNFPAGLDIPWPPGFDGLLALPGILLGRPDWIAPWAVVLPALLGAAAVYLTYRLGARAADRPTGLLAAALLAGMNGAVGYAHAGNADHHALVAPCVLGVFLWLERGERVPSRAGRLGCGLAAGSLAAFGLASWVITPALYLLPLPAALAWLWLRGSPRPPGAALRVGLATACLLGLGLVLATPGLARRPFALYQPSFLLLVELGLLGLLGWLAWRRPRLRVWLPFAGLSALLSLAAVVLLDGPLAEALRIAAGHDPTYGLVEESDPLLRPSGVWSLGRVVFLFSPLYLAWPLLAWAWARAARPSFAAALTLAWAVMGCGLMLLQERFGEFAAPALALLLAWGGLAALRAAGRRGPALAGGVALVLGLAVWPALGALRTLHPEELMGDAPAQVEVGRALARVSPEPRGTSGAPTYGVLTGWSDAYPILRAAGRPVIVSNFAKPDALVGIRAAFEILLEADEARAVQRMRALGLRYAVVSPLHHQMDDMAAVAGVEAEFLQRESWTEGESIHTRFEPREPFFRALHTRLYLGDGGEREALGGRLEGLAHFRLVAESTARAARLGEPQPVLKAFELVAGARLRAAACPGEAWTFELELVSPIGRAFAYRRSGRAGPDGRLEIVLPYPTAGPPGPVLVRAVVLVAGARRWEPAVVERQVREGETLELGPLAGDCPSE